LQALLKSHMQSVNVCFRRSLNQKPNILIDCFSLIGAIR
jgi:hypothetical protein